MARCSRKPTLFNERGGRFPRPPWLRHRHVLLLGEVPEGSARSRKVGFPIPVGERR
jgi:hypothetical protein